MSEFNPRNIEDLTSDEFAKALRIRLSPGPEEFVLTVLGRIHYAVSIDYGYSYTRPQLIEKYSKIGATYEVVKRVGQ